MIRVAGLWELGWNTPIKEMELWEYPLRDFGVDKFYMSPVSGIDNNAVQEVPSLEALIVDHRMAGVQIVFVDEKGKTELQEFVHPENVLYVFGKTSVNSFHAFAKPEDQSIVIKTMIDKGLLWSHQCACMVLYDRMLKCQ